MRILRLLPVLLLFFASTAAQAITVDILGVDSANPLSDLQVGDEFSVSLRISNPDRLGFVTAAVQAYGWDDTILQAIDAERPDSVLNSVLIPGGPIIPADPAGAGGVTPAGGIINVLTLPGSTPPAQTTNFLSGLTATNLIQGVALFPATGTGDLDPGVDGGLVGDGDAHARVTFQVLGAGTTTISFGAVRENADVFVSNGGDEFFPSTSLRVRASNPIPEPGAALVFAAGLATVAGWRRRR
ncbi:MAG: hypothetical protein AAGC67_04155 [Myxococcota bacterium]